MVTIRKAKVYCPKCGHGFIVRDNGGLTKQKDDRAWKAFDEAFARWDKAVEKLWRAFS